MLWSHVVWNRSESKLHYNREYGPTLWSWLTRAALGRATDGRVDPPKQTIYELYKAI